MGTELSIMISERAIRIVAEDKIDAALRDGQFDNLPGFGKPCPLIDDPYDDENWWIRRKFVREELGRFIGGEPVSPRGGPTT